MKHLELARARQRELRAVGARTTRGQLRRAGVVLLAVAAVTPPAADAAPQDEAVASAVRLVESRPAALHASVADAFVRHAVISTPQGLQYVPYDRTYAGLPVLGGDFVVVTDADGRVLSTSVAQQAPVELAGTTPKLTAGAAEVIARRELTTVTDVESTRLVADARSSTAVLAYESVVAGTRGTRLSRLHVVVDALSGEVVSTEDEVSTGTGTGWINGPGLFINTSGSGASFSMTDSAHPGIACRDIDSDAVLTGADDVWGNGDGTNRETGCVDSLFGVQRQWSMLASWLGRNGINGSGGGFPIRMGLDELNAKWTGSSVLIGHNIANQWVASLDVIGHEFGHAIDAMTPGGHSGNGVSEATGDIFGTATEWFVNSAADPRDYQIGEEVNLVGAGPLRYMYNPSLAGDPNCYSGAIPNQETHAAAGPFNHWFYLVAEGSNPTDGQPASPTCNGTTVSGLGLRTALTIFYNAMLSKTSGMTYPQYRTATLNAAKNLYPDSCAEFSIVQAAWDAVSVPAQPGEPSCAKQDVHLDAAGHVIELYVTAGDTWHEADLTALTGAPAAAPGSALSGYAWGAGNSKQVVYRDGSGHVRELYVTAGGAWKQADLTALTGAPAAAPGSALSGFAWGAGNSKQVVYLDGAGHVRELSVTAGGAWKQADLTALTGAPAAAPGSALSGYQWSAGNSKQVVYLDGAGHVRELSVTAGGSWKQADLTALTGAPAAAGGSALSGYQWSAGNSKQVAYRDGAGHVRELSVTAGGSWKQADLTALTGAPAAAGGSALSGYQWSAGNSKQVAYRDGAGHVRELYVTAGGSWKQADLTALTGAPAAAGGSALSGYQWSAGNSKQVAYRDGAGHVRELYVTAGGSWKQADLTALTGAPAAAGGSALNGYEWLG